MYRLPAAVATATSNASNGKSMQHPLFAVRIRTNGLSQIPRSEDTAMMPTLETPPLAEAVRRKRRRRQSVLLHNVDWATYEKLLEAFGDRRSPRMIYDDGELEIMTPSNEHEIDANFL